MMSFSTDRQLPKIARGSSQAPVVTNAYQYARLSSTTFDRGTTTRSYYPSGQLKSIQTPEYNVVSYGYNGPLLASESWTGSVSGSPLCPHA